MSNSKDGNAPRARNEEDQIRKSLDARKSYGSNIGWKRFGPFGDLD